MGAANRTKPGGPVIERCSLVSTQNAVENATCVPRDRLGQEALMGATNRTKPVIER